MTNASEPAGLNLVKNVVNENGGLLGPDDFQLTLNGDNAPQGANVVVPNTEYTVSELPVDGYSWGGVVCTDDPKVAFDGANQVFLVGSRPRTKDMDRSDLVAANGPIFVGQGKAEEIHRLASKTERAVGGRKGRKAACHSDHLADAELARRLQDEEIVRIGEEAP